MAQLQTAMNCKNILIYNVFAKFPAVLAMMGSSLPVYIWAKSASPNTKMLQLVKIEILDPSGGVLYD